MDDKLRESLSALMDDEANEIEVQRVLSKADSEQLNATWKRYHAVRDVMADMRGDFNSATSLDIDISASVAAAIREEGEQVSEHSDSAKTEQGVAPQKSAKIWRYGGAIAACFVLALGLNNEFGDVASQGDSAQGLVVNELDPSQVKNFNQYLLRHSELSALTVSSGMAPLIRVASVNSVGI